MARQSAYWCLVDHSVETFNSQKMNVYEKFCYENGLYFLLAYHISLKILKLAIAIFLLYSSCRVSKNLISKISY
jgi:hypothetical protein